MKKYGAAAGIPSPLRHFHVLKHCCATHLLSKGFGVERVQDWIGHANIQSTMEYAKVTNARRDDMAQQLKETWRWKLNPPPGVLATFFRGARVPESIILLD